METCDAAFVGAGCNTLACAAHLAVKGWRVRVFERAEVAGGAMRTAEVTAPGFRHDLGAQNLVLFAGSPFHQRHGAALAKHGLKFVPAPEGFATAFPDGRWFGVSTDLDKTCAAAARFSEKDAAAWRAMAEGFGADAPHWFAALGSPMTPKAMGRVLWKAWREKGTAWLLDAVRLAVSSPRRFVEERFESPEIGAALAVWGMHLDFPPDAAGGALFPYLEGMVDQAFGMVVGEGGAETAVRAMVGLIEEHGGAVETGAEVAEVTREGRRATGLRLADGREIRAEKAVIASVAPRALVDKLLPGGSGDAGFDKAMRAYRHGPGTMMIHLALRDLPDWSAGPELRSFAYVHLAPSLSYLSRAFAEAADGLLPAAPAVVVGQPTAIDPSRAPEGRHVLWLQVRAVPGEIAADALGLIGARDWAEAAEPYAERVLDILEGYAPGTRAKIIAKAVHSPADLEAMNPNLVGGDSICGSHQIAQNFLWRPARGWARWRTPVEGLRMIGAATWPGAGTGAGSGYLLAQELAGA